MNFKKTVAIATAAGALAAISVPAMAFENEFHGLLNFNTTFSNFQDGGSGNFTPAGTKENKQMNNYFEQRARIMYVAKASDDLKMVTQFEINNRFGNINTVPNSDEVYEINLPKSVNGTIFRLVLGPSSDPFHRYDCQMKVSSSGMESDSKWIPVR